MHARMVCQSMLLLLLYTFYTRPFFALRIFLLENFLLPPFLVEEQKQQNGKGGFLRGGKKSQRTCQQKEKPEGKSHQRSSAFFLFFLSKEENPFLYQIAPRINDRTDAKRLGRKIRFGRERRGKNSFPFSASNQFRSTEKQKVIACEKRKGGDTATHLSHATGITKGGTTRLICKCSCLTITRETNVSI